MELWEDIFPVVVDGMIRLWCLLALLIEKCGSKSYVYWTVHHLDS